MKSIKEIVMQSPYKGSKVTYENVKSQIEERWGLGEAKTYNPNTDCMPYGSWLLHGFKIRRGERALKSVTFIEVKDEKGNVIRKVKRTVNLFHRCQVEKMA